jgi:hypothetical protein
MAAKLFFQLHLEWSRLCCLKEQLATGPLSVLVLPCIQQLCCHSSRLLSSRYCYASSLPPLTPHTTRSRSAAAGWPASAVTPWPPCQQRRTLSRGPRWTSMPWVRQGAGLDGVCVWGGGKGEHTYRVQPPSQG